MAADCTCGAAEFEFHARDCPQSSFHPDYYVDSNMPAGSDPILVSPEYLLEAQWAKAAEPDVVNHPPHYTSHPSGVECIQITEHMNFNLGNALKYIWRADLKHDDATEDLEKAKWYIEREIARRKR
jgi:hypothetical protein